MLDSIFGPKKAVIGMVHLPPLPGAPLWKGATQDEILDFALQDAINLAAGGVSALIVENQNDQPFFTGSVPLLTVTCMTALALEIKRAVNLPMGINVLFNDWQAELAIAAAVKAQFIRVEVLVDSSWSDMGFLPASAPELLRMRGSLPVDVKLLADIQGKYTHPAAAKSLAESAADAESRGLADAVIVTGSGTGHSAPLENIRQVRAKVQLPVLAGSGITAENINEVFAVADGAIIGSYFKKDGHLQNPIDIARVRNLVKKIV